MGKYTLRDVSLRVGRSKTGRGVFACEDIPKGACIVEYTGKPVPDMTKVRDTGKYLFDVGKGKTIDGNIKSNRARFINHSCAPNCEANGPSGRVFILALRRIKAGEELTYDYGEDYFDKHIKPKGCLCAKCVRRKRTAAAKRRAAAAAPHGKGAVKPKAKATSAKRRPTKARAAGKARPAAKARPAKTRTAKGRRG